MTLRYFVVVQMMTMNGISMISGSVIRGVRGSEQFEDRSYIPDNAPLIKRPNIPLLNAIILIIVIL